MTNPLHPAATLPYTTASTDVAVSVTRAQPPVPAGGILTTEHAHARPRVVIELRDRDRERRLDAAVEEARGSEFGDVVTAEHEREVAEVALRAHLTTSEALDVAAALLEALGPSSTWRVIDLGGDLPRVERRWESGETVWSVRTGLGQPDLVLREPDLDVEQTMAAMRRRLAAIAAADATAARHSEGAVETARRLLDELLDSERTAGVSDAEVRHRATELLDALAAAQGQQ